jgi:CBS domain-containing protein
LKTSSISLRVADFLKSYPPFEYLEEGDLLALARGGRVKFHEADEVIYEHGQARGPYVWIVQRGTVNLYRPTATGEELIDVRVEGDLLSGSWVNRDMPFTATARVAQESILYALPAELFFERCGAQPQAAAFLKSYFTIKHESDRPIAEVDALELDANAANWLTHKSEVGERSVNRLLTAGPAERICDVAKRLAPGLQEALVVVDPYGRPLGVLTEADFSSRVATGEVAIDRPVSEIMKSPVLTISPNLTVGEIIMTMIRLRKHHLIVTDNGQDDGRVLGIVGDKTIQAMHGTVPIFLSKEFPLAVDINELRRLRDRADELLLRYIEGEAPIEWLTNFIAQVDRMLTEQAISLAKQKLASQGWVEPALNWAWVALHSEGRKERLLRSGQRTSIVYADPPAGFDVAAARHWFSMLANELGTVFSVCRFPLDPRGRMASNPEWCLSVTDWKANFTRWIAHPIEHEIISRTPFFDLRAVTGDRTLVAEIREHIRDCIARNPVFVPFLASNAMANLPPVTLFRDSVLDQAGIRWDSINTKSNALTPLVDIARVFALGLALEDATFTPDRYRKAAALLPQHAEVFTSAVWAFDHAVRLQTRVGLSRGDDARLVRPDELTPLEVQRVKKIFRTVAQLMDVAVAHFEIRGPRSAGK